LIGFKLDFVWSSGVVPQYWPNVLASCAERDCGTSLMRWRNEHVTDTPYGADGIGVSWIKFYLAAQTGNP